MLSLMDIDNIIIVSLMIFIILVFIWRFTSRWNVKMAWDGLTAEKYSPKVDEKFLSVRDGLFPSLGKTLLIIYEKRMMFLRNNVWLIQGLAANGFDLIVIPTDKEITFDTSVDLLLSNMKNQISNPGFTHFLEELGFKPKKCPLSIVKVLVSRGIVRNRSYPVLIALLRNSKKNTSFGEILINKSDLLSKTDEIDKGRIRTRVMEIPARQDELIAICDIMRIFRKV